MHVRTILYIVIVPLSLFAFESLNLNRFFKQNRVWQARLLYLFLSLGLSYLVVNFFMDFFTSYVYTF